MRLNHLAGGYQGLHVKQANKKEKKIHSCMSTEFNNLLDEIACETKLFEHLLFYHMLLGNIFTMVERNRQWIYIILSQIVL